MKETKYGFEKDEAAFRDSINRLQKWGLDITNNGYAVKRLIDQTFEGTGTGFILKYPGYGAQLAYERFTDILELIYQVQRENTNPDVKELYKVYRSYVSSERDMLILHHTSKIVRDEKLFKDIWSDNPTSIMDMDERKRQQYNDTESYFKLANEYYQSRSDKKETWEDVYNRMQAEQVQLGLVPRHKNFNSFQAAKNSRKT